MADADFSGVTNPKRVLQKREDEAMNGKKPASAAPAPKGGMSQAQFSGYDKPETEEDKKRKAADLARLLRGR